MTKKLRQRSQADQDAQDNGEIVRVTLLEAALALFVSGILIALIFAIKWARWAIPAFVAVDFALSKLEPTRVIAGPDLWLPLLGGAVACAVVFTAIRKIFKRVDLDDEQ